MQGASPGESLVIQTSQQCCYEVKLGMSLACQLYSDLEGCRSRADLQADVHPETAHSWHCAAGLLWHPEFACALSCNVDVPPSLA